MKITKTLLIILTVWSVSLFVASPALADHSITFTPNLSSVPNGWLVDNPCGYDPDGEEIDPVISGGEIEITKTIYYDLEGYEQGWIMIPVAEAFYVTDIEFDVRAVPWTGMPIGDPNERAYVNFVGVDGYCGASVPGSGPSVPGGHGDHVEWHEDSGGDIEIPAGGYLVLGMQTWYENEFAIYNLTITGTVADGLEVPDVFPNQPYVCDDLCLFKPVRDELVTEHTLILDSIDSYTVVPGADIHAAITGTVTGVTFDSDGYSVQITGPRGTVVYRKLAQVYVSAEDVITGGCLLGLAHVWTGGPPEIIFWELTDGEDPDTWIPSFSTTPCDEQNNTANCLNNNPNLEQSAATWSVTDGAAFQSATDAGIDLQKQGTLLGRLELDSATDYYVTVIAAPLTGVNGQLTVTFGEASAVVNLVVGTAGEYQIADTLALTAGAADRPPTGYDLIVENTYSAVNTTRVTFICVHEGELVLQPPACYFNQDGGITANTWSVGGGAVFVDGGQIAQTRDAYMVPPTGAIANQINIAAYSDADTDFTLALTSTNPDPILGLPPYGQWSVQVVDLTDPEIVLLDLGDIDVNHQIVKGSQGVHFTLGDGETLIGNLVLTNTSDEIDGAETWRLLIDRICLSPDDGVWPGYGSSDAGAENLIAVNCESCSPPADWLNVAAWLQVVICTLRNIWFCYAAIMVNGIWSGILAVRLGIGLFGRWLSLAISLFAAWGWDGAGRLLSQFIAWLIPVINGLMAWLQGLPIIQSLVDTSGLVTIWFDGVWHFVTGVIALFVAGLQFIAVLFGLIGSGWSAFIAGISEPGTVTFQFPQCTDPESFIYDACLPLDVLNFVVEKIPAFMAFAGAVALAYGWRQIKSAWEKTEETLST